MNLSKGWALTLGVFLGYQVAKLRDHMPFIVSAVQNIRDLSAVGLGVAVMQDEDADEEQDAGDDE